MRLWVTSVQPALDLIPRPHDAPQSRSAGTDSDRVLLFGAGPAVGWGVHSHELALPGSLARALSSHTGRGTEVDVVADPQLTATTALRALERLPLWRYDSVVLFVGVNDALRLTQLSEWRRKQTELIAWIAASAPARTQIVVAGIHPIRSIRAFDSRMGGIADRHGAAMNQITAAICRDSTRSIFVPLSVTSTASGDRHRSPSEFAWWARLLATAMAPGLTESRDPAAHPGSRVQTAGSTEARRQGAVDDLALDDTGPNERLDRLVALAQQGLGTETAIFTVLDQDRQWHKARVGSDLTQIPRSSSFCDHTIRQDGGMVVLDAREDTRFRNNPLVLGEPNIRFYAGYPIESPSGERIGALCVLDPNPRDGNDVNLDLLRELAYLVQRELWRYSPTSRMSDEG